MPTRHGRNDDDDTPPPIPVPIQAQKSDTEYNLVVPFDPQWFHGWRRELRQDLRDVKADLEAAKISATRLDQRLDGLYENIKRVEEHVRKVDSRVVDLENKAIGGSAIQRRERQSLWNKAKEGAASRAGDAIALGIIALLIFILTLYFKAQP